MSARLPNLTGSREPAAEWVRRPERSNRLMLRIMSWISLRLGRAPARIVLAGISVYFLLFSPAARAASRDYLRRALGREPRVADLLRHFQSFASTVHDRVFLINGRYDLFDIEVHGRDVIEDVLAESRGAFLMGAHMGSFEVVRAIGEQQPDLKVAMLMYEHNARKLNAALSAINPAALQAVIPLGQIDSMLRVRAALDAGTALGMLADRSLSGETTVRLPFLGDEAAFPAGPMRLAAMLKRPVLFMSGLYLGGNRYAIHFERLADFSGLERERREVAVHAALAAYAACLERHCRATPYNWFNFFDFWAQGPADKS